MHNLINLKFFILGRNAVGQIISPSDTVVNESDPAVAVVTVLVIVLLLIIVIVGLYMYRRMSRLKKENTIMHSIHFSNSQAGR